MDYSQFSTEDLRALQAGDLSKVSTDGLKRMHTAQQLDADRVTYSPTAGNSFLDNAAAATGKGMTSVARAVGLGSVAEKFGLPATKEEADRLDAPLMKTAGGKVGNVVGQATLAAPAMLIPGANTYVGAGLIGAGVGGLTTEGDLADRAKGAMFGAAGGVFGQGAGQLIGAGVKKFAERNATNALVRQTENAGKDAAVVAARDAGYVLPPTEVNPSLLNSLLEGASGKIKTAQSASTRNQKVTNDLVRKELDLPADAPVTIDALKAKRAESGKAYEAVSSSGTITPGPAYEQALDKITESARKAAAGFPNDAVSPIIAKIEALKSPSFDAASAIAKIKSLRGEADAAYASGNKDLGKALKSGADTIEGAIEAHLQKIGAPSDLLQNFREARQTIAKTYSVEKSLNATTGDVSAAKLAAQLAKGRPLSGELRTIAEANQAFPKATATLPQSYNALSPLDYFGGISAGASTGSPFKTAAAVLAARPAARSLILSKPYQNALRPDYSPSQTLAALNALTNNDRLRRLLPAEVALASNALAPSSQK